jgi:hypothetical protein
MERRLAPPAEGERLARSGPPLELVDRTRLRDGFPWDQYLSLPVSSRLGICCSGGGIRSASYNLGALQVLRSHGVLAKTKYLSAVSGGSYIAIAHAITVDRTLAQGPSDLLPGDPDAPPLEDREAFFFDGLAPWAPDSPEEQHLRDNTSYLAPGAVGKIWLAANLIYGMIRHLLPFVAGLYIAAALTGFVLARWIGPSIQGQNGVPGHAPVELAPFAVAAGVCVGLAVVGLWVRQWFQSRERPSAYALATLQGTVFLALEAAVIVALFFVGLPALLLWLHSRPLSIPSPNHLAAAYGLTTTGLLGVTAAAASLLRRRASKLVMPIVANLLGPLVIAIPFVGIAYWTALRGFHPWSTSAGILYGAVVVLIFYRVFVDEVTPNTHLFYRERLAKAFVTFRRKTGENSYGAGEPSWSDPILLSRLLAAHSVPDAELPELVICAAVNLSQDVPPGRGAAPFTFESDFSGSPLTGYVLTENLEKQTGPGRLTLPAMMAISGAALAPSMGKMTRPTLRMVMALLNVRLGVWLPNPRRHDAWSASRVGDFRDGVSAEIPPAGEPASRGKRPGLFYVLREALGLNTLGLPFVYVTDGGHWDNLGLVELLRRGCCTILCFDAAGDDVEHFHTLSEAIALARSDLGVEIEIDVAPLKPGEDGLSETDHVQGTITYPDGTQGVLLFAKAAISRTAPLDARTYREVDKRFPTDPTSDQLFNDARFEAYRALGRHAAERIVALLEGEPAQG